MKPITNLREYCQERYDEYRRRYKESWAKAEECRAQGDLSGYDHHLRMSLRYYHKCNDMCH